LSGGARGAHVSPPHAAVVLHAGRSGGRREKTPRPGNRPQSPGASPVGAGQVCPPKGAMRPVSRNFQARICCSAPVSPVAEGIEQPLLHPFRQILLGELSGGADGGPELPEVLRAAGAQYQVLLDLRAAALVDRSLPSLPAQP